MTKAMTADPATHVQFERAVHEYARWIEVAEDERSPAPAWWWGPAFEVRTLQKTMPAKWCSHLKLPDGSSFAEGAEIFLKSLAGQTVLPWSGDFPRRQDSDGPP